MAWVPFRFFITAVLVLCAVVAQAATPQSPDSGFAAQTLSPEDLDSSAFVQFVDGAERPLTVSMGPLHVVGTTTSTPDWDGVRFGDSKMPGTRHLRIGFTRPVAIGSILARAGGEVSVLKPNAALPGRPAR